MKHVLVDGSLHLNLSLPYSVSSVSIDTIKKPSENKIPYLEKEQFISSVEHLIRDDATPEQITRGECYGKEDRKNIDIAWRIYNEIRIAASPAFVLGRLTDGKIIPGCNENNPCIDKPLLLNMGAIKGGQKTPASEVGGILSLGEGEWSHLVNDTLLRSLVLSEKNIYLASRRTPENIFCPKNQRLTIMGRELIGMLASKRYEIVASGHAESLGEVAKFVGSNNLAEFGPEEYLKSIREYLQDDKLFKTLIIPPRRLYSTVRKIMSLQEITTPSIPSKNAKL